MFNGKSMMIQFGFSKETAERLVKYRDIIFGDDREAIAQAIDECVKEDGIKMQPFPREESMPIEIYQMTAFSIITQQDMSEGLDNLINAAMQAYTMVEVAKATLNSMKEISYSKKMDRTGNGEDVEDETEVHIIEKGKNGVKDIKLGKLS